ncbi:MAG: T9SS C-terminal target domain-containing protein [Calditrichaeota bacterium]|nr:MAG: T9SS C-terminal target domain-containing protein [Calditrichota bacterium]
MLQYSIIKKFFLLSTLLIFSTAQLNADTFFVTTTADSGEGSLRQAVLDAVAQSGVDTVLFDISTTDAGYNATTGVWTINSTAVIRLAGEGTIVDATSQTENQGDTNPFGPEIELDGSEVDDSGFQLNHINHVIRGFIINGFAGNGIFINASSHNLVQGNYIGTDATGTVAVPNSNGITMNYGAKYNLIGGDTPENRNIISGNTNHGIFLVDAGTDSNSVRGNYIGCDRTGEAIVGNVMSGIYLDYETSGNIIGGAGDGEGNVISGSEHHGNIYAGNGLTLEGSNGNFVYGNFIGTNKDGTRALPNIDYGIALIRARANIIGGLKPGQANIISGNTDVGVFLRFPESTENVISGNFIGTDTSRTLELGNIYAGIFLDYGANGNIIGPGNIIANNNLIGIYCNHDSTNYNTFTQNAIFNHPGEGIKLEKNANSAIQPPDDLWFIHDTLSGKSSPGAIVEIFSDRQDEGEIFEGSVTADANGDFEWVGMPTRYMITATATDADGNTSAFSEVAAQIINVIEQPKLPGKFELAQNYPNPFNPVTRIEYAIPQAGHVKIVVYDISGQQIETLVDAIHDAGNYYIEWDVRNQAGLALPSGIYFYKIQAGEFKAVRKLLLVR